MKLYVASILACCVGAVAGVVGVVRFGHSSKDADLSGSVVTASRNSKDDIDGIVGAVAAANADSGSNAVENSTSLDVADPKEPVLQVESFNQKIAGRKNGYVHRSWRVDVMNNLDQNATAYVEVEWLDADGFRVEYSNVRRTVFPGVNVLTDIRRFDAQDDRRIDSFRVSKVQGNPTGESVLGCTKFMDKVVKRQNRWVERAWRVDVVNNATTSVGCYVEVEWLDHDGHRVAYSNDVRTVTPGSNVITDTYSLDIHEDARIKSFRVVEINAR